MKILVGRVLVVTNVDVNLCWTHSLEESNTWADVARRLEMTEDVNSPLQTCMPGKERHS